MKNRGVRTLSAVAIGSALVLGLPSAANAGTADYQYTCEQPGQNSWAIPKGTRLSTCVDGYIYVRLNGSLVEVVPTNASGVKVNGYVNPSGVTCYVAIVGIVWSVFNGGWGWTTSIPDLPACLA